MRSAGSVDGQLGWARSITHSFVGMLPAASADRPALVAPDELDLEPFGLF